MLMKDLTVGQNVWAVADLGDVMYMATREEINNEFPTQHNVQVQRTETRLCVGNDDLSTIAEFANVTNVDIAVLAFTDMLLAVENMENGED